MAVSSDGSVNSATPSPDMLLSMGRALVIVW